MAAVILHAQVARFADSHHFPMLDEPCSTLSCAELAHDQGDVLDPLP
jgi:hypothetical protein